MLFVGDDWAEDHHDIEVVNEAGERLGRVGLPEGIEGISRLHAMLAYHLGQGWRYESTGGLIPGHVAVEIETRPWSLGTGTLGSQL